MLDETFWEESRMPWMYMYSVIYSDLATDPRSV